MMMSYVCHVALASNQRDVIITSCHLLSRLLSPHHSHKLFRNNIIDNMNHFTVTSACGYLCVSHERDQCLWLLVWVARRHQYLWLFVWVARRHQYLWLFVCWQNSRAPPVCRRWRREPIRKCRKRSWPPSRASRSSSRGYKYHAVSACVLLAYMSAEK